MQHEQRYDENGIAYSNTRLYKVWESMKSRCNTPTHTSYKHYGARGITVCKEWESDFGVFREWAMATGYDEDAPRGKYTLERIDTNGPYCPENCCWKTIQEQERNKRTTIYIDDNGERVSLAEYCERYGVNYKTEKYRKTDKERMASRFRKELKRRSAGVRPMEEYNRERAEKEKEKVNQIKIILQHHPDASIRQIADITGFSKSTIGRLKKKAETWHN